MTNEIAKITSLIDEDFSIFEIELKKIIKTSDNFLKDELCDFVFNNAKFLRPRLVFLFSKILKIEDSSVQKIALAVELLHNASLIHDDIIDNSTFRRNLETFNQKYNSKTAVLLGDLVLSLALKILSKTNSEIVEIFSEKIFETIKGELKQNENIKKITDEKTYLEKTFSKTGNLFFAGLESLFALKKTDEKVKNELRTYLKNFSLAFQIKNDLKDTKSDFENGNFTLPAIYCFEENKKFTSNENPEKYLKKTQQAINLYKQKAIDVLINNSLYKNALVELVEII